MPANIVLVLGALRSGSTVFEQYLARCLGTEAVGEVVNVFEHGRTENAQCTCGERFHSCPLWSEIMAGVERRMGGADEVERIAQDLETDLWRQRYLLFVHHRWARSPRFSRRYEDELRLLSALYEEIGDQSGAPLILDSSKLASYGHVLSTLKDVRVAYVLLIRDSRAVAHSWQRVKPEPQGDGLRPISYTLAVRQWMGANILAAALLPYVGSRMITVTYEEFVRDPSATLGRVNELLSRLGMPVLGEPGDHGLADRYHAISGNPVRFNPGAPLVEDVGWKTEMPTRPRLAVTVATSPLLAIHHFLLWRRSSRTRRRGPSGP